MPKRSVVAVLGWMACVLLGVAGGCLLPARAVAAQTFARETPTERRALAAAERDTTSYTLPTDKLQKAVELNRIWTPISIGTRLWTLLQLALMLRLGLAVWMRYRAERMTRNRWGQAYGFIFLLLVVRWLANLPIAVYGHRTALAYGFSIQGWASWLGDNAKRFGIEWALGGLAAMGLMWAMRRSPTRWWMWFWVPSVIVSVAAVFVVPYVIDPMFNTFDPLAKADPALVARLERVVARAGLDIPPERMFLMRASAKVTTSNAYVTGFGASKRVVVWDTTLARSTPDEIAMIFGHELGHYAMGHVTLGTALSCVGMLPFFWLGYVGLNWMLRRYGGAWGIADQHDWAALVALALVLYTLTLVAEPISNGVSRWMEHNADVYGQEAVHGLVADPQQVARASFQVLGEESFDDPAPHPLMEWWTDSHPPIRLRAGFARAYDPWAPGEQPKYFAR